MTNRPLALLRSAFAVTLLAGAMTLSANGNAVGKPSGGGSSYEWQTTVTGHDRIELTVVAPDGEVYVRQFNAGRDPSFRLSDLKTAADGQYAYELRVVPKVTSDVQRKLQDARENNDEAATRKIMRQAGLDQPVVQSGVITILNGAIVSPDLVEATAHDDAVTGPSSSSGRSVSSNAHSGMTPVVNDQVIADDLIVQGSTCVGLDCVANESFGFDTIRLKENNTRIKFEDTSSSAGFPTNDWQLTANDSASGGANKFSIEDVNGAKVPLTITAGASTNSIFVDSTGRVGFRTSTPVLDLHVATSNTPAIRLEQNSSGGFTAQTWDVAGNEANFFVRDVTSGSRLPFRIRPGAPTSSIDISASGDVGIGTASPKRKLHILGNAVTTFPTTVGSTDFLVVENNGNANMALVAGASSVSVIRFANDGDAAGQSGFLQYNHSNDTMYLGTAGVQRVTVTPTGVGIGNTAPSQPFMVGTAGSGTGGNGAHVTAGGTWTNGSSREFKDDIRTLSAEDAQSALAALQPVRYHYKVEPDEEYVGFIAEDVPDLVAQTSTNRKYLSPMDIVATLTKVVQEQQKTINQLSKKVDELSKQE